jgi:hypothetical protein
MPSAEAGRIDLGDVTPHNIKEIVLYCKVSALLFALDRYSIVVAVSR